MKSISAYWLSFLLGTMSAGAAGLQVTEVTWSVPTNEWPAQLWVYQVVPQHFSDGVVSNALALASFTMRDRTETPDYFLRRDRATMFFGILDGACKHLAICPTLGFIEYRDPSAESGMTSSIKGVPEAAMGIPNQEEATRRGLKYLRFLGIDIDQVATTQGSSELDLHWERGGRSYLNEQSGERVRDETCNFGVFFNRRLDGLNVVGIGQFGGVYLSFGNNAKIATLRAVWRNLQPYELHSCASPEQIVRWLRSGRLALRSNVGRLPDDFLKLTIYKTSFVYDGQSGDKPMDLVYPYAMLEASAVSARGTNALWFKAPLTPSEANWQILR